LESLAEEIHQRLQKIKNDRTVNVIEYKEEGENSPSPKKED
jgi:hypothetical protein